MVFGLCLVGCHVSNPATAQLTGVSAAPGWVADASRSFLTAHEARGRFQRNPVTVGQTFFNSRWDYGSKRGIQAPANRDCDVYVLSLTGSAAATEDDMASLVFGVPAPADRFEITLFVQPGQTIQHRTITVDSTGACSGIGFPGAKEFLYKGAPAVRVTAVPRGKDITRALTFESASRDFTLRLRIESLDIHGLHGALYLCLNDGKMSFVEGRFTARVLDDVSLRQTVWRTRALADAIEDDDVAQLRVLLKDGCNPDANLYQDREESRMNGEFGYDTLLTAAVVRKQFDCVAALLQSGADVNLGNSSGATPLMIGALVGDMGLIDLLLEHGANSKAVGPNGKTALHFAIDKPNNLPVCKRLVEVGADIDAADDDGCTPLFVAVLRERLDLAQWLVDHHADINHKDRQGNTALYYGKTDAMRIILLKAGANQQSHTNPKEGKR